MEELPMSMKSVIIMVLGLLLLYGLFTVGLPFLLALVVAIFLDPITVLLMRSTRMNRMAAGTLLSTIFALLTIALFYFIGLNVVTELILLGRQAPSYLNDANVFVDEAFKRTQLFYESLSPEMAVQIRLWLEQGTASLMGTLKDVLTGISGFFLNLAGKIPSLLILFIVFVIALYLFTYSLPALRKTFLSIFDDQSKGKMEDVLVNLRLAVFGYIRAQLIMAVLTYLVTFIGLLLIRAPYPLAIALLVMVLEFVPVIGTGLVFIPWASYELLVGNTGFGIAISILFLVLTIFRRIVEPKVLSDAVGINSLAALISLYVGFELVGIVGIFLGPMVVILYQALRKAGVLQMNIKLD
jgi:sporulation integral membrane protein YtvI